MSGATRNLKAAVGKVPARRTGTAYEASISGRGSKHFQSPIVIPEDIDVDAAGIWNEGRASYPGRSVVLLSKVSDVLPALRGVGMGRQKSAEAIVAGANHNGEGPNMKCRKGALVLDDVWRRGTAGCDVRQQP